MLQLNNNALISLEDLKQFLGIDQDDHSKDFILTVYINGISDYIQGPGQSMLATDYVEQYQGTGTQNLILKHKPINSIASLKQGNSDVKDYEILSGLGILYRNSGWPLDGSSNPFMHDRVNWSYKYIEVKYNAGYQTVPSDLLMVLLGMIDSMYSMNIDADSKSMKSYKISDVSITWRDTVMALSPSDQAIISKYKGINI